MQTVGWEHQIPSEDVYLEALEDTAEQSEEPDETRAACMGRMAQCIHTRLR